MGNTSMQVIDHQLSCTFLFTKEVVRASRGDPVVLMNKCIDLVCCHVSSELRYKRDRKPSTIDSNRTKQQLHTRQLHLNLLSNIFSSLQTSNMLSLSSVALAASTLMGFASAAPTITERQVVPWTPGTLNNTQEFYVSLKVTKGSIKKYNGWTSTSPFQVPNHY